MPFFQQNRLIVGHFLNLIFSFSILRTIQCVFNFFHNRGPYHIETSPLIYPANQWTGFYMIKTSVMKELKGLGFS